MRRALVGLLFALSLGCSHVSATAAATLAAPEVEVQPTIEDMVRSLHLMTIRNARDLGGLRGSHAIIPHNRFFRSATLVHASEDDRIVLLERGVRTDIDLRTIFEAEDKGDPLSHDARFSYDHVSLLGVGLLDWFHASQLRELYVNALAHHQGSFRKVFHALATHTEGGVLFHCTSGKDRTGMVTAMLFDLAGVERDVIVRDYAISSHYLRRSADATVRAEGTSSPPSAIEHFLAALDTHYGGTHAYLRHIGLPESEIQTLIQRLGQ